MLLESHKNGPILVVNMLEPRLDARVASDFKQTMNDLINDGNHQIVVSLKNVDFIDSSGLGAIVASLKSLGNNGDMAICGTREAVNSLFSLTRMDKVFQMFRTEEEAIGALSKV